MYGFYLLFVWLFTHLRRCHTIGCFVCTSINGNNPQCEDTFDGHVHLYKEQCMSGRKNRNGLFPADSCVKFIASNETYSLLVRDCSVDNGDITSDTEMGRESHCWMVNKVIYNDRIMTGCSLSCKQDGCNGAKMIFAPRCTLFSYVIIVVVVIFIFTVICTVDDII